MDTKEKNTIVTDYVTDMLAVEKHILEAIERQAASDDTAKYPEAARVVGEIRQTLQRHCDTLERFVERRGGEVKASLKDALFRALGVAAGLYDQLRSEDKVSRMIRDDYTALGLATISYHMLHTTALGLREEELAQLALDHLKDLSPLVVDLSKTVCLVVAQELTDEGKVTDPTVGQEAVRKTQEAWSGPHVESNNAGAATVGGASGNGYGTVGSTI